MKIFFLIALVGVLFQQKSFGQVVLLDNDSKTPVAYAHVISSEGILICVSDIKGVINLKGIQSTRDNTFFIHHISYQDFAITKDSLLVAQKVLLKPKIELLPVLTVRAQTPDYLVLKGYFTSYQTEDDIPQYYMDGIAEYYIPIGKKKKVKRRIIQYRVYSNEGLIQEEKKQNIRFDFLVDAPYLDKSIVTNRFDKKYYIHDSSTVKLIKLKENDGIAGTIWEDIDRKVNRLKVDLLAPKKGRTLNIFGYTAKFTHHTLTENYQYGESNSIIKDDLISRNNTRRFVYKHKKDKTFREIKIFTDLFVLERKYLNKFELKEIDFSLSINTASSHYSSEYWEEKNMVLPSYIKNAIDRKKLQLCDENAVK